MFDLYLDYCQIHKKYKTNPCFPTSSLFGYDVTARIQFMFTKASGSHSQVGLIGALFFLASCHLASQTTMATPLLWPCELVLINSRQRETQEEGSKEENV